MKILVTGASGFVGRALCEKLHERGHKVVAAQRESRPDVRHSFDWAMVGEINESTDWAPALEGVDTVIHLAARVHVMQETSSDPGEEFGRVNVRGTERLAMQAVQQGVKRFVFLSSIKVNGESTHGRAFRADDPVAPSDPYAVSKRDAEQVLARISEKCSLSAVVVRSPLVYGPEVGGNFVRLLNLVKSGVPLPLGLIHNRRSLVGLENLCDCLMTCALKADSGFDVFLVADDETVSSRELVIKIARLMKKKPLILPVPYPILKSAACVCGIIPQFDRLCGSLEVDIDKSRRFLPWSPPFSIDRQMEQTVRWYLKR